MSEKILLFQTLLKEIQRFMAYPKTIKSRTNKRKWSMQITELTSVWNFNFQVKEKGRRICLSKGA